MPDKDPATEAIEKIKELEAADFTPEQSSALVSSMIQLMCRHTDEHVTRADLERFRAELHAEIDDLVYQRIMKYIKIAGALVALVGGTIAALRYLV